MNKYLAASCLIVTGLAGIGSHAAAAVSTVVIPRSSTNGEVRQVLL